MKITQFIMLLALAFYGFNSYAATYQFSILSQKLGYPNETYFGATEEEIQDLETYTSKEDTYYKEINSFLRFFPKDYEWSGISPDSARAMVKNIDQIFSRVPSLPQDLFLFRGIDLNYRKSKSFTTGDEFVEKGYLSTSTSFKVAKFFATEINDNSVSKSKKAIFLLYLNRKNVKGILFDQAEDEVLLKHGEKIRIMDVKSENRKFDFYLAQICPEVCETKVDEKIALSFKNFKEN